MGERYKLASSKDAVKVKDILRRGMYAEGNPAYEIGLMIGHEDGEVTYVTRDDQTKITVDSPYIKRFVISSRENTPKTRKVRDALVKLLRKNAKVSIRKE